MLGVLYTVMSNLERVRFSGRYYRLEIRTLLSVSTWEEKRQQPSHKP